MTLSVVDLVLSSPVDIDHLGFSFLTRTLADTLLARKTPTLSPALFILLLFFSPLSLFFSFLDFLSMKREGHLVHFEISNSTRD